NPVRFMDHLQHRGAGRLAPVVRNRPGLLGIFSGHYHMMQIGLFEGVLAVTAASTAVLNDPSLFTHGGRSREGSGFNLCSVRDSRLQINPILLPGDQREIRRWRYEDFPHLMSPEDAA